MRIIHTLLITVLFAPVAFAQTWSIQATPTVANLNDVFAVSVTEVYAAGEAGVLLRTTDGGQTWANLALGNNDHQGIEFSENGVGISATDAGSVYRTTNGTMWSLIGTGSGDNMRDVAWGTNSVVWLVGRDGAAVRSSDAGLSWSVLPTGAAERLLAMDAVGTAEAWVVGEVGTILHTTDSGATWTSQASGTTADLKGIHMLDASTGYVVGNNNTVRKTVNGGATWTNASVGGAGGDGLFFLDANTGWVVDNNGVIWFTVNGGTTWAIQPSGTNATLSRVHFANGTHGWAVGDGGTVAVFESGFPLAISCALNAANPPPLTIPAAGQTVFFDFDITNSSGGPYTAQFWLNTTGPVNLPEIGPITRVIGAGGVDLTLRLKMTAAAPAGTWTRICDIGDAYPTSQGTSQFSFDKSALFAPGDVPVNGVMTEAEFRAEFERALDAALAEQAAATAELPTSATLDGNYPNPFNPSTTLSFSLPETAEVSLVVFDVMGREVARLVDGTMEQGRHEVSFDASQLPSGMYFARFTAGSDIAQTQRLTLLK